MLDRLDEKSHSLAANPYLGARRDDLVIGLRHLPVGNYLILYREAAAGVEVVRYLPDTEACRSCSRSGADATARLAETAATR